MAYKLKQLYSYRNKLNEKREILKKQVLDAQRELSKVNKRLEEVNKKVKTITGSEIQVSEHAIVRFQERISLVQPTDVHEIIVTEKLREMVDTLGDGQYPLEDAEGKPYYCVIRDNVVITVFRELDKPKKKRNHGKLQSRELSE